MVAATGRIFMARQSEKEIKRLYLSSDDKKLAGVCGGIGEYFGVDSTLVRLVWIIITIVTAVIPGVIGYVVAAIVIPNKPVK